MKIEIIPDSAPFNDRQRAWLNGFLAGVLGVLDQNQAPGVAAATTCLTPAPQKINPPSAPGTAAHDTSSAEPFPWHDPSIPIDRRMHLAEGKPRARRLMAAMAQLNCGSCGYLCQTYAEAIDQGKEKNLTLCSPGGSETSRALKRITKETPAALSSQEPQSAPLANAASAMPGTRDAPILATLIESRRLNAEGSAKDTRHVVFDLSDSELAYRVGDALGVYPTNCSDLIDRILQTASLASDETVLVQGSAMDIAAALRHRCLRTITDELIDRGLSLLRQPPAGQGEGCGGDDLRKRLEAFKETQDMETWDVLEFLAAFRGLPINAQDLVDALHPLRPRLYSIASSPSVHPRQVHLTVGRVEHAARGRPRKGVASTMLADRLPPGAVAKVFVQPSHGFTIPSDPHAPMIMVGPGTGIAPFIAFLQQRQADQAPGRNWLFFGDQRRHFDFLYEDSLKVWLHCGLLSRLDLAFSRDSQAKVYVQDRMRENGAELFDWLQQGAYFFVCGDAARMAADVDRALNEIIAKHGGIDPKPYVAAMVAAKRYVRDVY
jgi:sulfite reductase (NADPH) flavoprotein alpha-component